MLYAWILFAQEKAPVEGPGPLISLMPIILIVVVFYFLIFLPSRKEKQQRLSMIGALKKNDKVITSGGIIGVVSFINEKGDEVTLKLDNGASVPVKAEVRK